MKRKFLVILLALASALCLVFGLSACSRLLGGSHGGSGDGSEIEEGGSGGDHTHHFEYVYNDDATCTEDGTETEHCDSCDATGETRVKEGTKLGHDMREVQASVATCTKDGIIHHWHCDRCELDFQDEGGETQLETVVGQPHGHNIIQLPARSATCSECGYAAYNVCSRCGYTEELINYTDALHVKYELLGDHYIVSDLDSGCTDTEIAIPSTYKGLPVTLIESSAFEDCSSLTSITIPESVTSIGWRAFYDCRLLQSVTFEGDSKLTSIGEDAFYNCSSLTSITIPASVTSIGFETFRGCYKLVEVWNYSARPIKEGDTGYGYVAYYAKHVYTINGQSKQTVTDDGYIFYEDGNEVYLLGYTGNETSLTLPDTSPSGKDYQIYQYAFRGGAFTSVNIPESVTSIGGSAFYGCSSLTSITIPESVTSIGGSAFWGCNSLTSVTIPFVGAEKDGSTNTHFGYIFGASSSSYSSLVPTSLKEVIITGGTSIGGRAFYDCSSLTSITIPASVTSIGGSAFYGCSSLTSIIIPEGVISIGNSAFYNCSSLQSVTFDGESQLTSIEEKVFCNCSSLTSIIIPEGVTSIEEKVFCNCSSLTSIIIPEGVTSIEEKVFYNCSSLQSITIPESVTSIGSPAFSNCSSLQSVTFEGDSKLTSIGESAFYGCGLLQSVTFEGDSQLTSIELEAFYDCRSLTSITIPERVTSIGRRAFYGCRKLIEVWNDSKLPIEKGKNSYGYVAYYAKHVYTVNEQSKQTVTDGGYIFYEDGNEVYLLGYTGNGTSLTLPAASPSGKDYQIYQSAFMDCDSLTSITIPESVTSIGSSAFYDCRLLKSVTFEGNSQLTSIGSSAFYDCRLLKSVTFEGNSQLTSIGSSAFYDCRLLKSITIPASVTSIGEEAFMFSSLQSVTFEGDSQLTSIERAAFRDCGSLTSITIPASVSSIGDFAFYGCSSLQSVRFERTDGWKVSLYSDMRDAKAVTVSNPQTAAEYLRETYYLYDWKRY